MSCGVLECDILMLQNDMLMICNKRFYNETGHYLCQTLYMLFKTNKECHSLSPKGPGQDDKFYVYPIHN